jgi:hypothetical protein
MSWRLPVTRAALLLMESFWVYAIVAFLVATIADGGEPGLLGVTAIVFASYGISRLLQNSDMELGLIRAWGTFLSFIVFYAIIPPTSSTTGGYGTSPGQARSSTTLRRRFRTRRT